MLVDGADEMTPDLFEPSARPQLRKWVEELVSAIGKEPGLVYDLGRCFYTQSPFLEAEQMYLQVLALKPDNIKAEEN